MSTIIVKHRVANFETWKSAFESQQEGRRQNGFLGHTVIRDASDPNVLTLILRVGDLDAAKRFVASPELQSVMSRAGVLGPPEVCFGSAALQATY